MSEIRILVVEDDEQSADLIARWLRRNRYADVDLVRAGEEGLALYRTRRHDVLVLDESLPGADGSYFASLIAGETTPEARPWLVLWTAMFEPKARALAERLGYDDLVMKPTSHEDYARMFTGAETGLRARRKPGG